MIVDIKKFAPHKHRLEPYDHQRSEFEKTRSLRYYALFWEMGTGKTKPIIDTATWLFLNQEIDGLLIVSDKGCYMNWVYEELPKHLPDIPVRIAYWGAALRKKARQRAEELLVARDDVLDILCINVEAFSSDRGTDFAEQFLKSHYAMMVIDESTSVKSPTSARAQSAIRLGRLAEYRRIATGTPITQDPLDLFSQCQFLEPGSLGFTNFTAFKCHYAIQRQVILGNRRFMTIDGYRNMDELTQKISTFSSRIMKEDCLDLPPKVYEVEFVEMTEEQAQLYGRVRDQALAELDQGLLTSTNALTTIEKLHQICCGHVKLDDGLVVNVPNNRLTALIDLLERTSGKAIIWCAYRQDVRNIMSVIEERLKSGFAVSYYGEDTMDDRMRSLDNFKNNPGCRWFVGTAATGGKSLTLVEASMVVYYSNTYRLEHRLQSEDRAHRIGQTRTVTYVDLAIMNTVDMKIVKRLKEKQDIAREVLDPLRMREFIADDLEY